LAREFSSSEYSKRIAGIVAGQPPAPDLAAEKRLIDCLVYLASVGTVNSAHDISDGGLAVTLAESCFASFGSQPNRCHSERSPRSEESLLSCLGAKVILDDSAPSEFALFGERGARAIVSVPRENLAAVLATGPQYGVDAREIGSVISEPSFRIQYNGCAAIDSTVDALRDTWVNSLERAVTGS
jgi:phosphoribosylformylglycinamidine synthase